MNSLHVLYDSRCEFCRRCRGWLGQQAAFVPLKFIPFQSPEVAIRFPGIEQFHPEERLVVISDAGEVWHGDGAWIMCLWALCEFREWSQRLANPLLRPFARQACELVSENRRAISRWFVSEPSGQLHHVAVGIKDASWAGVGIGNGHGFLSRPACTPSIVTKCNNECHHRQVATIQPATS